MRKSRKQKWEGKLEIMIELFYLYGIQNYATICPVC